MSEVARLDVLVSALGVGKTKAELAALQGSLTRSAGGALKATAALAGIGGAAVALKAVTQQTVGFDKSMRNVNSIAQLNERQFGKLEKSVLGLAGKTAQAPITLADGLYDLVSSGFNATDSIKILTSSAKAATAGLTDTATSTKAVAAVLNAYHLRAKDAKGVSDALFRTVDRGVLSFEDLAQNIGDVLPWAANLKVDLAQVGAAVATMTKNGESAPEAMTKLKGAMVALVKPSDAMKASLKELGVSTGGELIQKTGSLQGALSALFRSVDGNTESFQKLFPDIRGAAGAMQLTGRNARTAAQDLKALDKASGATSRALGEQSKSVSYQWEQMKANASSLAIQVGSALIPSMSGAAQAVSGFVQEIMSGQGAGGQFRDVVETLGSAFRDAYQQVSPIVGTLASLTGELLTSKAAVTGLVAAMATFYSIRGAVAVIDSLGKALRFVRAHPVIAATVAAAGLIGALSQLGSSESIESRLARENADAHRAQAEAIRGVGDAERVAAESALSARQAAVDLKQAHLDTATALKEHGRRSIEYRRAALAEEQASLRLIGAQEASAEALEQNQSKNVSIIWNAKQRLKAAAEEVRALDELARSRAKSGGNVRSDPTFIRTAAKATEVLVDQTQQYYAAVSRVNVSETNRLRLMNASKAITAENVRGVSAFVDQIAALPKSKQTKLLLQNQEALAKIGESVGLLDKYGKKRALARVLANNEDAKSKIQDVLSLLASVRDKTFTITGRYVPPVNMPGRGGNEGGGGPGRTRGANGITLSPDEAFIAQQQAIIDRSTRKQASLQSRFSRKDYLRDKGKYEFLIGRKETSTKGLSGDKLADAKERNKRISDARKSATDSLRDLNRGWKRQEAIDAQAGIGAAAQAKIDRREKKMGQPTAADYASASMSAAQFSGNLTAAQQAGDALAAARLVELVQAQVTGDPRKIDQAWKNLSDAAQVQKSAAEAFKTAAESVRDNWSAGLDAELIKARVLTPDDMTDDRGVLTDSATVYRSFFDAAVAGGDTAGVSKWGQALLGIQSELEQINGNTAEMAASNQEQIDLLKQQLVDTRREIAVGSAQAKAALDWISSGIGNRALRGSTTPPAGRRGSL